MTEISKNTWILYEARKKQLREQCSTPEEEDNAQWWYAQADLGLTHIDMGKILGVSSTTAGRIMNRRRLKEVVKDG